MRTLIEARDGKELGRHMRRLERIDLIVFDEVGFVPFDRAGGELRVSRASSAATRS